MSYLDIEQKALVNLENALNIELIRSNRAGAYAMTTVIGCNTRKYHCMLAVPFDDGSQHILISGADETIIQRGEAFRLGIRRYSGGIYEPHGHRYINKFESDPTPARIYRVGGVVLKKEQLLVEEEDCTMVRYTILEAHSATTFRLQPFLAFRNIHSLMKANMNCNTKVVQVANGIKSCLYEGYPELFMQISKPNKFIAAPDWYLNIEYEKEMERGYEYTEDLFVPGFFEIDVKKGDSFVFSAGTEELKPAQLKRKFSDLVKSRIPRTNFENCLINSAQQFFNRRNSKTLIVAGFPWYGFRFRETIIALPGLTLGQGNEERFLEVMDSLIAEYQKNDDCFPLDIPLLIIRAIQQYTEFKGETKEIAKKYKEFAKNFLTKIYSTHCGFEIRENGMIYISETDKPTSWMDETENGKTIVRRYGYLSEINALWYNALLFLLKAAKENRLPDFKKIIGDLPEKIKKNYTEIFWNEDDKNLYDFVSDTEKNTEIRPNQLFAAGLTFSPLDDEKKSLVVGKVRRHLLTERGIRTLSPKSPNYIGMYSGNEKDRRESHHQGTVHPWLIGLFCDAWINIFGAGEIDFVEKIYLKFEEVMFEAGLGTISELYDGDPPHKGKGAVSYAPSVAELLRLKMLIEKTKKTDL
jgi:predicted glycogen debranching enzyme